MRRLALLLALVLVGLPTSAAAHPGSSVQIDIQTKRIEAQPDAQLPYIARGAIYSHDGAYELALADFRKAETLGEPFLVAYELGLLHRRMGKFEMALQYLDTFLEHVPAAPPALEQRAHVLAELERTDEAVATFEQLFGVQPRPNPGLYIAAAKLLAAKGQAGIEPALALLDRGMERQGILPQLQQYAVELELAGGHEARALARLESLGPVLGEGPYWKVDMGELLLKQGKTAEARRYLSDASNQLTTLRPTRARQELAQRIEQIQEALGPSSGG